MRPIFEAGEAPREDAVGKPESVSETVMQTVSETDTEQSISEVADAFGVTMRTLRFYESKGLLAPRRIGNRRFYNETSRARLGLVLKGKAMGLGLDEISDLVSVIESGLSDAARAQEVRRICMGQRDVLQARRDTIDEQLEEVARVLDGLTTL